MVRYDIPMNRLRWMCICAIALLSFCSRAFAQEPAEILILNSNASIAKYRTVQEAFVDTIGASATAVDLKGEKDRDTVVDRIKAADPDLIYCIGANSYTVATAHFSDKPLIFSSIINWLRLPLSEKTYGISNELHTRMTLMMYRYIFPGLDHIGVLYSREYTLQWYEMVQKQAEELGIRIIGKRVESSGDTFDALTDLFEQSDAFWLIPDPLVMPNKQYLYDILKKADKAKVPVFSYHEAFAQFGASLIVSVDNPTIGRQAAGIAAALLAGKTPEERVQFPAGSHITLNLNKVESYGLEYNKNALSAVNNIIK